MRKKCVRWTKSVRAVLIIAIIIAGAFTQYTGAHSTDPSLLPRLSFDSLEYVGAFRMPKQVSNNDSFSYGGKVAAFNPASNSLFVSSRAGRLAEVSIPSPVTPSDVTKLPLASYLQPFADPMEGRLRDVASSDVAISGLMVYNDRLYGTASIYYDASNTQTLSHFSRSLQLNQPSFSGWSRVWGSRKTGFVAGYLSLVPAEWRSRLGGPAATGQCCIPIVTRTSWGPATFSFDPAKVGEPTVPANPLLYYTGEHATLGPWSGSNPVYGATIQIGGMAIVGGTRTALFVGRNGIGPYCYGNGTSNPALDNKTTADGMHHCYDPTTSDKGQHAYPYRYQIWAYDVNDLAAVKAGEKQPWQVVPYGVWPFDLPTPDISVKIGGVTYDSANQLLYVTQLNADKAGVASHPIMHVFRMNVPPPPVPLSAVSISANAAAPQKINTAITFAATTTAGTAPFSYKWSVSTDGTTYTPVGGWTTSNTFAWKPDANNPNYRVAVTARSAWNGDEIGEAAHSMAFPIATPVTVEEPSMIKMDSLPPTTTSGGKVTAVSITSNYAAPQYTGQSVTFAASPTGGGSSPLYKWLVHNGVNWIVYKEWSDESTFTFTPGTAGNHKVSVWAKNPASTRNEAEASVATPSFGIVGATVAVPPPPAQTSPKYLAVFIAPDKPAPQTDSSAVVWNATGVGGSAPALYKWFVYDGATWVPQGDWSNSSIFVWKPVVANAKYRVRAWVKGANNTADAAEASMVFEYLILSGNQ